MSDCNLDHEDGDQHDGNGAAGLRPGLDQAVLPQRGWGGGGGQGGRDALDPPPGRPAYAQPLSP